MPRFSAALDIAQVADPPSPVSGRQRLYFKSDGILYSKNAEGTVTPITGGSGGGTGTTTVIDGGATPSEAYDGVTVSAGGAIMPAIVDAKGDLIAATGVDSVARFPVGGTTGYVLTVDPASAFGISWSPAPTTPAPSNMLTTDTAQVVSGAKTYPPNTLLMRSSDGLETAEPYSDINAPLTLERTIFAGPAAGSTPVAGQSWEWTPDGKSLWMESPDGTYTLIGPSAGGGNAAAEYDLTQDWSSTTPTPPTTGVTLFTRHKARRILAQIGPNGVDTPVQPALFSNRVSFLTAAQGSATETQMGMVVARTTAPSAGPALANTSFYTRMAKLRYSTSATVGTGNGPRTASAAAGLAYFLSNTANLGGFFFVARFGVATSQAGSRGFIGMSTATAQYPLAADPSAGVNQIGFGWNAAHTNLWLMCNGATANTASHVDLGVNYPTKTSSVDFYECRLFVPSGVGTTVNWAVTRLNTGTFNQGSIAVGLPALDVFMAAHVGLSNGTTAAIAALDLQSLYIETDN